MSAVVLHGEALAILRTLPAASVDCCVTSPPYFRLRDYGVEGQIGMEPTHHLYVAALVAVFREVRRVLKPTGTLWLNLGDTYAGTGSGGQGKHGQRANRLKHKMPGKPTATGLKYKDLFGIPWRVALALQDDGWWLRSDIIWHKPNPTPASVTDRPTSSHEHVFLLAASEVYHYDAQAVREASVSKPHGERARRYKDGQEGRLTTHLGRAFAWDGDDGQRNRRDVWTIPTQPSDGTHPAPMPSELARICVLAGCPRGGVVLDPFCDSGTTLLVADRNERHGLGIELHAGSAADAYQRVMNDAPLLNRTSAGSTP